MTEREDTIELACNWLDTTAQPGQPPHPALDEERDRKIQGLARQLARCVRQEGAFFSFGETVVTLDIADSDVELVKERLYELALRRVLRTFAITDEDRSALAWIARSVRMQESACRAIETRVVRQVFELHIGFWMSAGRLDEDELRQVRSLAAALGLTPRDMFTTYLQDSGVDFLARIVTGLSEEGQIPDSAWSQLLVTVGELGLTGPDFVKLLRPQVRKVIEKLLADVKMGLADESTPKAARALLDRLGVRPGKGDTGQPAGGKAPTQARPRKPQA